jgi:hypothetical protein
MRSLAGASELYVVDRERLPAILAPDTDGVPTLLEPQPLLLRTVYLSSNIPDGQISNAQQQLSSPECSLFAPQQSPDGPPYRSGLIFTFKDQLSGAPWKDEKTSRLSGRMRRFAVTTPHGSWNWTSDAGEGRLGYFLTGQST